jgi:hypothetical protein
MNLMVIINNLIKVIRMGRAKMVSSNRSRRLLLLVSVLLLALGSSGSLGCGGEPEAEALQQGEALAALEEGAPLEVDPGEEPALVNSAWVPAGTMTQPRFGTRRPCSITATC